MILYSRWEQGSKKIEFNDNIYLIDGKPFESWKDTLQYLGKKSYLPPSKYFRRDSKYIDFLRLRENLSEDLTKNVNETVLSLSSFLIRIPGINFEEKINEIRKLVYSGFSHKITDYDREDIFQEILKGLLIRNQGICPFNPNKSSFGSYIHMVASCVIANYHQKNKKHKITEEMPLLVSEEDPEILAESSLRHFVFSKIKKSPELKNLFERMLSGEKIVDMAEDLGYSVAKVSKQVGRLRKLSAEWAKLQEITHLVPKKYLKE